MYGYAPNKPQVVAIIDSQTQTTYSLDLNRTVRHRDYFIIKDVLSGAIEGGITYAEYDEGLITFATPSDVGTGSFSFSFSSNPIITLTVESASLNGENVNVYGYNFSTTGFTFGTSAPFVGTIRYRAIYSPTYPANATSIYTGSMLVSAGEQTVAGVANYTASFSALPGTPFKFLDTTWNTLGNGDVDVWTETQTSSSSTATIEISSPYSSLIHFQAFY